MPTRATAPAALVERLRDRITAGVLPPGAPLRQEELAADFGVSRIPVRDALAQLQSEGLVELRASGGVRVATLTPEACGELFDLRVLLECDALRHAVPRHTPRTLQRAASIQAELEFADDAADWIAGDRAFHEALYAPGGRARTVDIVRVVRNVVERFAVARLSHDARRAEWRDEHRALLDAAAAGDAAAACERLTAHLRATVGVVRDALAATPPAAAGGAHA
jgi:DNA-binding GntR family transcriptional regulator